MIEYLCKLMVGMFRKCRVNVNGRDFQIRTLTISYQEVVALAGLTGSPSVTCRGKFVNRCLSPGQAVAVEDNMTFTVAHTDNA